MKNIGFLIVLFLVAICAHAQRHGQMGIAGEMCGYDTLVHKKIGPGMVYTQYQFNSVPYDGRKYKMRAHVIAVDMNNPYNAMKPYMAKNQYFTTNTQVQQVKFEKQQGRKPIASISGLDWVQSTYTGTDIVPYEVSGSFIRDKEIKFESPGERMNLYYGSDKTVHFGYTEMKGKAVADGKEIEIGQVNHFRHLADAVGKATLFCNGISKSRTYYNGNQGVDVLLKKTDGEAFKIGQNSCTVVGVMAGCGHSIASGEAILSGTGTIAEQLQGLSADETVTITMDYVNHDGEYVDIDQQFSTCFPTAVDNGQPVAFSTNTAYPCFGVSQDGKTLYLADLEISQYSNCPTICMSYLLSNIGVWTAYWGDGGPSAEMTIDGSWVTINSIGYGFNGRYIPDGAILYSTAPDDENITDIELEDPSARSLYMGDSFDVSTYAYNQYGEMILKNAEQSDKIEVTCTPELGTVTNGTFEATNVGTGYVYVRVKGTDVVKSIPVTITERRTLTAFPHNLYTGEGRKCQLTLSLTDASGTHSINPADAVWSSNTRYVVTSCDNGLVEPMIDGHAYVYVTYDGLCDTVSVIVENLQEAVESLDLTDDIDYEEPYIELPSVPYSFTADVKGEPGSIVTIYYTLGDEVTYTQSDTIAADSTAAIHITLDYDAPETYPVTIEGITTSSKNQIPTMTRLIAYYTVYSTGINEVVDNEKAAHHIYSITGQRLSNIQKGVNIVNGRKVISGR